MRCVARRRALRIQAIGTKGEKDNMVYSLSRYEQEVIINFNAEEDTATLYTANPAWIRKLDRLVEQNPEQFEMYRQEKMDGRVISKAYRFSKRFITVRSKDTKRELTDEQRAELAQRMREHRKISSAARNEEQEPQNGH